MRSVVDPRFRAVIANHIMARGLSQSEVAKRANVSRSYLSELINGTKNPSPQTAKALDEALGAGGELATLVAIPGEDTDLDHLSASVANPRRIGQETIDAYGRVLAAQRNLDDAMGASAVLDPTIAQMRTLTAMAAGARGDTRRPVLYQAGQWAQFLGWLNTSLGRWDEARRWFGQALTWAMELNDADLIATVLSYQAHVAWLTHDPAATIGLAQAAMRDPAVYPGQSAYDAYQSGRAHAALGDLDEAARMLDLGDSLADATDACDVPVPVWQYYRAPWYWRLERGLVRLYMARHDGTHAQPAAQELASGMAGMPAEMRNADWTAEYLVHLATAHERAGELDAARSALEQARPIVDRDRPTRSSWVRQIVHSKQRALAVR
ncbi:MAG: helix-turn-helix domain-containing protein [Micromonosporaceae bacterium]